MAAKVTLRQLLDHTSGLTVAQVPELSRRYHNPNCHVAARLVEVLGGEPFGALAAPPHPRARSRIGGLPAVGTTTTLST